MTAVFTIVSKNYLAFARTLMASVREHHPDMARFVILVDRIDGSFDAAAEDFTVITSDALPIPQSRWFHFKYTILELNTAVKPYAIEYLTAAHPIEKVFYLDPDIKLYGSIEVLERAMDENDIILTPHLLAPLQEDAKIPGDLEIMRSGAYNLGFIGVRTNERTREFIQWWQRKLYDHCFIDFSSGLFTDQKWIDLVPGAFPKVHIERSPAYNVAYWNISQRTLETSPAGCTIDGQPLAFFHFSGFDPLNPQPFSKYQNRFTLDQLDAVRDLALDYAREVLAHGHERCREWQYVYSRFENGTPILDVCRRYARLYPHLMEAVPDPFSEDGFRTYVDYWSAPSEKHSGALTRIVDAMYLSRPDLQHRMPNLDDRYRVQLLDWAVTHARAEYNLPDALLGPTELLLFRERRELSERLRRENDRSIREKTTRRIEAEWARIPAPVAAILRQREDELSPVLASGSSVAEWLSQKVATEGGNLPRLAVIVLEAREDLRRQFPGALTGRPTGFLGWFVTYGRVEYSLTPELIHPLQEALSRAIAHDGGRVSLLKYAAPVAGRTFVDIVTGNPIHAVSTLAPYVTPIDVEVTVVCGPAVRRPVVSGAGISIIADRQSDNDGNLDCFQIAARAADLPTGANYDVNLFEIGSGQPADILRDCYNIAYCSWELDEVPSALVEDGYDEIWVPSRFCQDVIARGSLVPIMRVPPAIPLQAARLPGVDFGLSGEKFTLLTRVNLLSSVRRQNPKAVIDAFRLLDPAIVSSSLLVIQIEHSEHNPTANDEIRRAGEGLPVVIIDRVSPTDAATLIAACDAYISLHRSTAFGVPLAEAMYCGKPVIATAYSGSMDFTAHGSSLLVRYDLRPVGRDEAPGSPADFWAEPDIADAAGRISQAFADAALRAEIGARASRFIREQFAPSVVGTMMKKRIRHIAASRAGNRA